MRYFIIVLLLVANNINADKKWDEVRYKNLDLSDQINISAGTGIFVNNNQIVTSYHVVNSCRNIAIRGAVKPTRAKLIYYDKNIDLAILQSNIASDYYAFLSKEIRIYPRDKVYVAGYPLEYSKTGNLYVQFANILSIFDHIEDDESYFEFNVPVNFGNSGGPLFDQNQNIIGIVKAKKTYLDDYNKKVTGIAVPLDIVKNFLRKKNIPFRELDKNFVISGYNEDYIKKFIVNIHCIQ